MTDGADRHLRRAAIAASVSLVLMVGATAGHIFWPRAAAALGFKPAAATPAPPASAAGPKIDVPVEWYNGAPKTLVLFARASCGACEKAQPFLKSIVAGLEGRASAMMAHPAGTEDEDTGYARSLGIAESNVRVVTANLRVKATPTLVLVNQQGAILAAWEGAGAPDKQAEIKKTIEGLIAGGPQ